ncbi:transporter hol1 [Fusarium pseudocircinatum]|uniref:Transporter hol1 n=1 Tax=Fusarium pseudocircinatum TaxID=56676 RepID=A0A8H5NUX2_9HYPO|nr:transporter hol1 [Fusarium pseudocircinatum]
MAEALGTASAIITIWDLVGKAREMHSQIKAAPGVWKLYCDDLESLAHVQVVIQDMIQSTPRMAIPDIQVRGGQSQNLVTFLNNNLETIRKQATNILDQHDLATNRSTTAKKFFEWLRFMKKSFMFTLDEKEIRSLREAVESAKSTLQLALQLLFTNKFFSGMKSQAVRLESIEKNSKLSQIPLKLNCGKVSASRVKRITAAALKFGRLTSKSNHAFKALLDSGTVTVTQLVEAEAQPSPGTGSQDITLNEQDGQCKTNEDTKYHGATDARVDMTGTNDEETGDKRKDQQEDNHSSLSKSLVTVRQEKPQNRQYDLVWRDSEILSVRTDTDMYKAVFEAQLGDYQNFPVFTLDCLLENPTDAQQGQDVTSEDGLQDFLALEMPSADESDTEPITESFSIQIDCQRPTYAFLGNSLDSTSDTATSLLFCVWVVCDLQACQIFALQEPCDGPCKHVGLEVMDISTLQRARLHTMTFRSMSYSMLLNEEAAVGRQAKLQLDCFNMCQNGCRHTLVEGVPSPEACCVRPVTLRAWSGDDMVEGGAVTSSDDGASCGDSIATDSTLDSNHDHDRDDDDDDERALDLWQAIMNRTANGSDIPARIELDVLVSYIKVVDKYKLKEPYRSQSIAWADALLPNMSTSFDEDAIAWLWILWRLHMPAEFKNLSAIAAQQATGRIGPEHYRYGVEIPESIIDAIERRRVYALSQIRDCIHLNIRSFQDEYANSSQQSLPPWIQALRVMSSAVTVGYLTLETQRHLPDAQEGGNPNFCGVSFEDAAEWIRSMMDLGDWMIRTVPPARRMPRLLADLATFVPVLGVGLHESGISTCLSPQVHKDLTNLITRLKAEDWGIDLECWTDLHVGHETDS